jgi:hypothetical protein
MRASRLEVAMEAAAFQPVMTVPTRFVVADRVPALIPGNT